MTKYDTFHLIADLIRKEGASCVLIGGFAVNFHKYSRNTTDVDFLITKEDFQRIKSVLERTGYKNYHTHENFVQFKDAQGVLMDVDFMFVDQKTIEDIQKEGKTVNIVGETFTIPSLQHLIALKLHAMKFNKGRIPTDMLDVVTLIKINKLNVKDKEFEDLCLKFGTKDIYLKILEYCQ